MSKNGINTEHKRMVNVLCKNTSILAKALNEKQIYIRSVEYVIDEETQEKADILFQNYDIGKWSEGIIAYIAEIKSDQGDHELLGQIEKSVDVVKIGNNSHHFYSEVRGIAIVKEFTKSGLSLLNKHGYLAFEWKENDNGVCLVDVGNIVDYKKSFIRNPVIGNPHYTEVDIKILYETNFNGAEDISNKSKMPIRIELKKIPTQKENEELFERAEKEIKKIRKVRHEQVTSSLKPKYSALQNVLNKMKGI